jgi:hypothetical protein
MNGFYSTLCYGESQDDFERQTVVPISVEGLYEYSRRIGLFLHFVGEVVRWIQLDEYSLML